MITYGTRTAITITLASLASDANLLTGRESNEVNNSVSLFDDIVVDGKITTGTTPTDAKEIRVYVAASWDGTTWPDVFDGTDSAETITSSQIRDSGIKLAMIIPTNNTSDRTYPIDGFSVAQLYGGRVPKKFVVFVTHGTAVPLHATGSNHQLAYTGISYS